MLKKISLELGRTTLYILDRGYANSQMLEWLFKFQQDFVLRWKKNHLLVHHLKGEKKTHLLARSFRPQYSRLVQDKERRKIKRISIAWASVQHPDHLQQNLTLVIVRDKKNFNSPMYLISSLPVQKQAQAWEICFSYFQRWDIEQAFRFGKSELAMESPRLWFWENRLKLLAIVALVYDFLLHLIRNWKAAAMIIIERWCHRTGERYRNASIPLYRLRLAISICLLFCLIRDDSCLPEEQHIRKYTVYWVGEQPHQWCAVFYCPCGCKELIYLNLLPTAKPCWSLTPKGKKHGTFSPSVHRIKGCKSRFFVIEGRTRWV
ncbi:MAG: DUF6527 family protein [Haliscomenobacter sp.]|uniref:DUF6527 family protein n=1 Tax=Haliscomenobacter sp. TaxID=2717303 RepID=UPI0029AF615D|nr:DUF6527 family protein [Haliscomenobacter sp.]MDX2072551.1 DUF6527 family protein [Haliscomenobacter sp.]